jgi:hypothetical protein
MATSFHVPVVIHKTETDTKKRQHEVKAKEVAFDEFRTSVSHARAPDTTYFDFCVASEEMQRDAEIGWPRQVEQVVQDNGQSYNHGLRYFGAVDTRQDVDAVGTKSRQHRHVNVVQRTYGSSAKEGQ